MLIDSLFRGIFAFQPNNQCWPGGSTAQCQSLYVAVALPLARLRRARRRAPHSIITSSSLFLLFFLPSLFSFRYIGIYILRMVQVSKIAKNHVFFE